MRIELTIEVLQTSALPLGDRAGYFTKNNTLKRKALAGAALQELERETGIEPATSTLARSHSTAELLPLAVSFYSTCVLSAKFWFLLKRITTSAHKPTAD